VIGIRSELQFSSLENSSQVSTGSNLSSIQLVIFSCIYDRFLSSKLLLDVWIKTISRVPSHAGHKYLNKVVLCIEYFKKKFLVLEFDYNNLTLFYFRPLDVVIMFLAYSAASNDQSTKSTVLSIFKERLKNGFIRSDIMEKTFQTFTPVGKHLTQISSTEFFLNIYIFVL